MLIGGCTGSGKTLLVQQQPNGVDLEGLARIAVRRLVARYNHNLAGRVLKTCWLPKC